MLSELGDKLNCGKSYQGYLDFYESIFNPIRNEVKKVLEIGIRYGQSLNLWEEYFPNATIYGIDIEDCSKLQKYELKKSNRIVTFVGNQNDRKQMKDFIDKHGGDFDIIIEDGSHSVISQQISLGFFFKYLKPGGYYSIEDLDVTEKFRFKKFDEEPNLENTTWFMIRELLAFGKVHSKYMEIEESRFINNNLDNVQVLYHLLDDIKYPHLKDVSEKNFSLGLFKRKI